MRGELMNWKEREKRRNKKAIELFNKKYDELTFNQQSKVLNSSGIE